MKLISTIALTISFSAFGMQGSQSVRNIRDINPDATTLKLWDQALRPALDSDGMQKAEQVTKALEKLSRAVGPNPGRIMRAFNEFVAALNDSQSSNLMKNLTAHDVNPRANNIHRRHSMNFDPERMRKALETEGFQEFLSDQYAEVRATNVDSATKKHQVKGLLALNVFALLFCFYNCYLPHILAKWEREAHQ